MRTESLIEAKNLTAYRGSTRVFEDFSLTIERGCNTAILGPNGSGKTTFLKLISREIHPMVRESSRLTLFGKERYNVWELRGRLGIVSHDLHHGYIKSSRGLHVILSGYYSSNDTSPHMSFSEEQIDAAVTVMNKLGIDHLAERRFADMSTGQQRRFLLGRALIHEPEALILDEPTEGLDLRASLQYFDTVRGLMQDGTTVVLSTHHIHEIMPEIERVVLLKEGAVFGDGPKSETLTADRLSGLFEYPLEVLRHNEYYRVVPANRPDSEPIF